MPPLPSAPSGPSASGPSVPVPSGPSPSASADRARDSASPVVFVVGGTEGGYRMVLGGVVALERKLRELAKEGVTRALVAAEPIPLRTGIPIEVEWVSPSATPPPGARVVRGDEIAGIRVRDEATRRQAEWALCRSLAKSHQGVIDGLLNWRLSMRITRALAQTSFRFTPNHVTAAAAVVGLAASALVCIGTWAAVAAAGVLMQLQSILDSCDGELARLRFQYSKLGQWFDNLADDVLDNLFLACAGWAAGGIWATCAFAGAGARLVSALVTYVDVYVRTGTGDVYAFRWWFESDKKTADDVYDPRSPLTWVRSFARRDLYVFVWMGLALAYLPEGIAVYGAVLGAAQGGLALLHVLFGILRPRRKATRIGGGT